MRQQTHKAARCCNGALSLPVNLAQHSKQWSEARYGCSGTQGGLCAAGHQHQRGKLWRRHAARQCRHSCSTDSRSAGSLRYCQHSARQHISLCQLGSCGACGCGCWGSLWATSAAPSWQDCNPCTAASGQQLYHDHQGQLGFLTSHRF